MNDWNNTEWFKKWLELAQEHRPKMERSEKESAEEVS